MTERDSAARRLRGGVWPVLDEASEHARRERIASSIVGLTHSLERRRQRRRRWTLGVAAAALVSAACALALVWPIGGEPDPVELATGPSLVRLLAGQATLHLGADVVPLAGSMQLSPDAELVTPADASAELRLSSSTEVSVAPSSQVKLSRRRPSAELFEERVRLEAGSVALAVPKLGTRGKVSVETRDALVEVHGTRFSVRVGEQPPGAPFTEVQVREGRVLVRAAGQSHMLGAGDTFSTRAPAVPPAAAAAAPAAAPDNAGAPSEKKPRRAESRRRPVAPPSPSELAEQNRLLEAAELAQRGGMPSLAVERLEQLIERFPDSELAHNARVERFRVLARSGRHAAAVGAARAYLERHPDGFAREEAVRLIGDLP